MGNSSSRPILQTTPPNQEYPTNGARGTPLSEKLASGASKAFSAAWSALKWVLRRGKDFILLPVTVMSWLTPASWKAWLAEKLCAIKDMLCALYERGEVWLNRKEIAQLTQYLQEERELTEEIRARIAALPQSAQRQFNRIYQEQADAEIEAVDQLADLVNAQAERLHNIRDHMDHATEQTAVAASTAAPAPGAALTPPQHAVPAFHAPVQTRRAQLQADIERLTRELSQLQAEQTED